MNPGIYLKTVSKSFIPLLIYGLEASVPSNIYFIPTDDRYIYERASKKSGLSLT